MSRFCLLSTIFTVLVLFAVNATAKPNPDGIDIIINNKGFKPPVSVNGFKVKAKKLRPMGDRMLKGETVYFIRFFRETS